MSVKELAQRAFELNPVERIHLVEAILYSLDKPDPEVDKAWIAESIVRYEAFKKGEIEAIDWDDIKRNFEY